MAVFRLSLSLSSVVPDPCIKNILNRHVEPGMRSFFPYPYPFMQTAEQHENHSMNPDQSL
jgi:hypothetical protein